MKTLLLTLVVVTIVCLDLGHTRQCYVGYDASKFVTCPEGENHCYSNVIGLRRSHVISRGCASSCSPFYRTCCGTDKCND
uniref:Three-finger toxin 14 n=2 Tax=Micrurus TaxID=8634 RepID=A0A0H4J521_9SAUR|nr:three-finger toxin precursor D.M [Micrurus diastema]AKO63252.1 three-finger toxin precursor T.E [Micrurus tener]